MPGPSSATRNSTTQGYQPTTHHAPLWLIVLLISIFVGASTVLANELGIVSMPSPGMIAMALGL